MLTRRQLSTIATKEGMALHSIERDYVQTLFLYQLYASHSHFIFKGGTCLRMGYQLNRYSEDLDFNYYQHQHNVKDLLTETTSKLLDFGIEGSLRITYESSQGIQGKLRYSGPLYVGKEVSKGTTRIDVSLRGEPVDTNTKIYRPLYDDCPTIPLHCLTLDHIIAEKIRALIIRGKPRDLYDVWFFHGQSTITKKLLNQKLQLYEIQFETVDIEQTLEPIQKEWKQDMMPLLGTLPEVEIIKKEVEQFLSTIK
jgi:hypothetical protein